MEIKRIMESGMVICYKTPDHVCIYKYVDTGVADTRVVCDNDTVKIYVDGKLYKRYSSSSDVLVMIIEENTPESVMEIKYRDGVVVSYMERKATFEDNLVSNFVKEELIRGNITAEKVEIPTEGEF